MIHNSVKYIPLIFLPEILTWNKMVLLTTLNRLTLLKLEGNELKKTFPEVFNKVIFCVRFIGVHQEVYIANRAYRTFC